MRSGIVSPIQSGVRSGIGKTVFNVLNAGDCVLWLDASDPSTVTLNGSDISQLDDKSSVGVNFPQVTASQQPAYSGVTINGRQAIEFDGVDECLYVASGTIDATVGPKTIFIVFANAADSGSFLYIFDNQTGRTGIYSDTPTSGKPTNVYDGIVFPYFTDDDPMDGTAKVMSYNLEAGDLRIFKNGTQLVQTGSDDWTERALSGQSALGAVNSGGSAYFNGTFGELIIYRGALSEDVRAQAETYLQNKWKIS